MSGPAVQQAHGGAADAYFQADQQERTYEQPPQGSYPPSNYGFQLQPPQQTYQQSYQQPDQQSYQQSYQQQYQQQTGPPNPTNPIQSKSDKMHAKSTGFQDFSQAFKIDKPRYNDIWAALLFVLVFAGFTAVSGISLQGYSLTIGYQGGSIYGGANSVGLSTNTIILFAFVLVVGLIISLAYFWVCRAFTKQLIWITAIIQIVLGIATSVVYLLGHHYGAGVVFLVFVVFYIICFITWIPRIPFSTLMLQVTIDVAKNYGHVFIVSAIGGIVATAFGAWFSVTLVAIYAKYEPGTSNPACDTGVGGCSTAKVIGLVVFITFAAYWITEVIKNVIHVTISGVYGSWYFCSQKPGGFPKRATRGAFSRAMTYSFGSISFGSLLVSIIQLLRQACSIARQNEAAQGNVLGSIMFCILGWFIGFLDWAIQFINEYAFSYIALYGRAYLPAAKATWAMMKDRGIDALVNECLINPVLTMGAVFVGYLTSFFAYLYLVYTAPRYNSSGSFTPVVMAFAFLIGLQLCNIILVPIKSGVATFFVAMAFDPEVLIREYPDLYQRLVIVYPHVQEAIHV